MRGVNTFQCSASPLFYVHPHFLTECLEEARGGDIDIWRRICRSNETETLWIKWSGTF